jgi:hypothetical protein
VAWLSTQGVENNGERGNDASIEGIFVTKRGRPKKMIVKPDAQRSAEYRLRQKLGVHSSCKAIVGEPWLELRYPVPPQDVTAIWTGTCDEYVALPGEFCWWPFPGHERPKYGGGDPYILARRHRPYCWRRGYKHISGPSDTPLDSLLGRRCWENKDDDASEVECDDGETTINRVRFAAFHAGIDARFDRTNRIETAAGHIDEEFEFNKGPRCLVNPPIKRTRRHAVGATVNIVPAAIPFAPNWRDAMADMMGCVPSREKATPFSGEWSAQAAQGGDVSYSRERRWRMRLEPEGPIKGTWRKIAGVQWEARMDKARRQATEREAAGIPLRGESTVGGKSIRHLSREWLAGEAPLPLAMAA